MGVKSCSRSDCDSIMCDTYVNSVGYVCYDCQKEFKEYIAATHFDGLTDTEFKKELEVFMKSEKGKYDSSVPRESVETLFRNYTH